MLDKINEMKNNLTNVQGKVEGTATVDKIKSFGLGGVGIILLGFFAQLMFPWWSIAVVAFFVGFVVNQTPAQSMAYGMVATMFLWTAYAGWQSTMNGGIVSNALSGVFGDTISGTQLIFLTGLIGGLVGGMAAMTGTMFRDLFKKEEVVA